MKRKLAHLVFILILASLVSCTLASESGGGTGSNIINDKEYSFDAVKLISPDITSDDDPLTFEQAQYRLSPRRRLLLRFEDMVAKISEAVVSDEKPIQVVITLVREADVAAAQTALRLCPLKKTWMMLATWSRAYPIDSSGVWTVPGGDFSDADCVAATSVEGDSLIFKVNDWVQNEVRGRGVNFGVVLTSEAEIDIEGDLAYSFSPRLKWTETTYVDGN